MTELEGFDSSLLFSLVMFPSTSALIGATVDEFSESELLLQKIMNVCMYTYTKYTYIQFCTKVRIDIHTQVQCIHMNIRINA